MARVLVPLADGVEEIEAVIIVDVLRRAQWDVVAAGLKPGPVTASRGVQLLPDATWSDALPDSFDVLLLPGGSEGTANLSSDDRVLASIRRFVVEGKLVGAICAAPLALQAAGVLDGRRATCHPGVRAELTAPDASDERVVIDGRIITSQGPGTAFEFALAVIEAMDGSVAANKIAAGLVLPR